MAHSARDCPNLNRRTPWTIQQPAEHQCECKPGPTPASRAGQRRYVEIIAASTSPCPLRAGSGSLTGVVVHGEAWGHIAETLAARGVDCGVMVSRSGGVGVGGGGLERLREQTHRSPDTQYSNIQVLLFLPENCTESRIQNPESR